MKIFKILSFDDYNSSILNENLIGLFTELTKLLIITKKRNDFEEFVDKQQDETNKEELNSKLALIKHKEDLLKTKVAELEKQQTEISKKRNQLNPKEITMSDDKIRKTKEKIKELNKSKNTNEAVEISAQQDYAEFLKFAKSNINFFRRKAKYPKLKGNESDIAIEEEQAKGEIDLKKEEYLASIIDKINAKIENEIEKIDQSELPLEKKKLEKTKFREVKKTALENAKSAASEKMSSIKKNIANKFKQKVRQTQSKLSELESEYPIEVSSLNKKWAAFKAKIDLQIEIEQNDKLLQLGLDSVTDVNSQKRLKDQAEKNEKKIKDNGDKRVRELQAETEKAEKELSDKIDNASPDTKESLEKIKDFSNKLSKFMSLSSSYTIESSNDEIDSIVDAREELNDAKAKITPSLLKKAGMANAENADEVAAAFTKDADDAIAEFKEVKSLVKSTSPEEPENRDPGEFSNNEQLETLSGQIKGFKPQFIILNETVAQKFKRLIGR